MAESVSERSGGLAATVAEARRSLDRQLPGLIHEKTRIFGSAEELLNSSYGRGRQYHEDDRAGLHFAEGFFDPKTGDTVIIAGNIAMREGETPRQALARVVLHERVGHDGLNFLLGSNDRFKQRWSELVSQLKAGKGEELAAIGREEGYKKLAGDDHQLAMEWFARQAEKNPALLQKPGLLREAWQALRELVADLQTKIGLNANQGRALDDQVQDILMRARRAALQGKNEARQTAPSVSPAKLARP